MSDMHSFIERLHFGKQKNKKKYKFNLVEYHPQTIARTHQNNSRFYYNPFCNYLYYKINVNEHHCGRYHAKNHRLKEIYSQFFYKNFDKIEGVVYYCVNKACNKRYTTYNGIVYHIKNGCRENEKSLILHCPYLKCKNSYKTRNGLECHIEKIHKTSLK